MGKRTQSSVNGLNAYARQTPEKVSRTGLFHSLALGLTLLLFPLSLAAEEGLFHLADTDGSNTVSRAEFRSLFHENEALDGEFHRFDIDDDGRLSQTEWDLFSREHWDEIGDELAR